ncbi:MAG TPA: type II secretion system protein GspD [Desulfobulbaceae bacterium]|nr:type II secretion system protein GspD [Desulfobulbaceae bacterium]
MSIGVKNVRSMRVRLYSVMLCFPLLFLCLSGPSYASRPGTVQPRTSQSQRYVTIDFNDVDINLFIKYISELTKKNFVVDRAVRGKVTIISPTRISEEDAYKVFESVLEVNGFTTVPSGSIIKIVPAVQARSKAIATIRKPGVHYPEDKVVTQIIKLTNADPREVKKILAPLVSKTSVVISHPESGILIITDVQSNIERLLDIIKAIDVPSIGEEVAILPLKYASASAVGKSIGRLFQNAVKKGSRRQIIRVIPYERTNSLIVFAPGPQIKKIKKLLSQLDTEIPRGEGDIHVYYLQNADAEEMVKVLANLPEKKAGTKKVRTKAPAISDQVKITADKETNSLIITAPREEYMALEDVIKKLDIPRRMVYLEALIMEVSADKSFEVGVQWGGAGNFDDGTGTVATGFSGNPARPFDVINGLKETPPVLPAGFTFGVMKQGIKIGNVIFPNLGAVLKAFRNDSDINIVATPQILTMDNKKASIVVGENVPYITSQNTTTAQQDYTNYEYKDVATTLEITPQINHFDVLRLEIMAEVIKLKNPNDVSGTPTTFKRKADTTVVVHNNETIVIGGIIGQDSSSSEFKVPLLGDIPILGWLFKTRTTFHNKTNLYIFITPKIVDNPAELASIYYKKRDIMEDIKKGSSAIVEDQLNKAPNPQHSMELTNLGFAGLKNKEYDRAKEYFEEALKIDPKNPYALVNLGVACERQGDRERAAKLYNKVLRLETTDQFVGGAAAIESLKKLAKENLDQLKNNQKKLKE